MWGGLPRIHIQRWLLASLCSCLPLATKLAHTSGKTDNLRGSCPGGAHLTAK